MKHSIDGARPIDLGRSLARPSWDPVHHAGRASTEWCVACDPKLGVLCRQGVQVFGDVGRENAFWRPALWQELKRK